MDLAWTHILFALVGVAVLTGAWRSWSVNRPILRSRHSRYASDASAGLAYAAIGRLFDRGDFAMLKGISGLSYRLRAKRQRALTLFLGQLRREFATQSRWVRECAAANDAPELAMFALRQSLQFYPLYCLLKVQATVGWVTPIALDPTPLLRRIEPLRELRASR